MSLVTQILEISLKFLLNKGPFDKNWWWLGTEWIMIQYPNQWWHNFMMPYVLGHEGVAVMLPGFLSFDR